MNPWQSPEEIPRRFYQSRRTGSPVSTLQEVYDAGTRYECRAFSSIGELKRVRDWAIKSGKHINDYE